MTALRQMQSMCRQFAAWPASAQKTTRRVISFFTIHFTVTFTDAFN
jgi:hypothetical protein